MADVGNIDHVESRGVGSPSSGTRRATTGLTGRHIDSMTAVPVLVPPGRPYLLEVVGMTTETVPAWHRSTTILSTEERDGDLVHRVRWQFPDDEESHELWASEPREPIAREIIEDRWNGLMDMLGDSTKLQLRFDQVLHDIAERLTRRDMGDHAVVGGEVVSLDVVMLDGLQDYIRDRMIERAMQVAGR